MYKLIASDLDETLLRRDKTVSREDIEAIHLFEKAGGMFVCNTGRPFTTVQETLKELGQYGKKKHYVISYNGAVITENDGNRVLHFEGIPFAMAELIYKQCIAYDVCVSVYTLDTVYVYNLSQKEIDPWKTREVYTETKEKNIDFLKEQNIVKCFVECHDTAYLKRMAQELKEMTTGIDITFSSDYGLEFNKEGVNKGEGLKKLAEILHIDLHDTIAIGDNFNDLPAIKTAGLGICPASALEVIKPYCDHVTEATYEQSAIHEVIERWAMGE